MILRVAGPRLAPAERALFTLHQPRGVILFRENIEDPAQLAALVTELREALPEGALLMVDQEGGRVARLRPPHWPALPAAGSLRSVAAARAQGLAIGAMVKAAGLDVTAAPVLDSRIDGADEIVGDRALGSTPEIVSALGFALATGIREMGVIPVIKHIPGHGRATVDSHKALPRVGRQDLSADFAPFRHCRGLGWAMTAHIVYEAYDPVLPATLSKTVIDRVIRGEIGFTGTLISDDLSMGALSGTPAARVTAALAAGCDIALYCPPGGGDNQAVLEAVNHEP